MISSLKVFSPVCSLSYFPLNRIFIRSMLFIWMSTHLEIKKNRLCFRCVVFQYKKRILQNSTGKKHVIANKHCLVQSLSWFFATPWTAAQLPCPSPIPGAYSISCPSHWWCYPNISSSVVSFSHLQSSPASGSFQMSGFPHIRWPKYCSFSFSISPSNEYSGLISFRMDWLDLLAVQRTLKSLLQVPSYIY